MNTNSSWKVVVGGARGTRQSARPDQLEFGGETLSILLTDEDRCSIVLDAGSGLRRLLEEKNSSSEWLVLLTHYHIDHLLGLGALAGRGARVARITIRGPRLSDDSGGEEPVRKLWSPPLWPSALESEPGVALEPPFDPKDAQGRDWRGVRIRWLPVHHPGGAVAYRLDLPGSTGSVALVTDFEWPLMDDRSRADLIEFLKPASPLRLLLISGPNTDEKYEERRGWGHGRLSDAIHVGWKCGAERLGIIHHDPDDSDAELRERETSLRLQGIPGVSYLGSGDVLSLSAGPHTGGRRAADAGADSAVERSRLTLEHGRWQADHLHSVTVMTDAKAVAAIAMLGGILAGTFQGLQPIERLFKSPPVGQDTIATCFNEGLARTSWVAFALVWVAALGLSLWVLRPRSLESDSGGPPGIFFGRLARFSIRLSKGRARPDGAAWVSAIEGRTSFELRRALGADIVAMAMILDSKVRWMTRAVYVLILSILLWLIAVGLTLAPAKEAPATHTTSGSETVPRTPPDTQEDLK